MKRKLTHKMADNDDLVQQFVSVTGADVERARFYLESSAWDLELAMSSFFESVDNDESVAAEDASMPTDASRTPAPKGGSDSSKIATFSSMTVDSGSSDEEGQAYYAGGSDRSGQQVLGPPKKKDANKIVETLFKSARDHGAEEKKEEDGPSRSKISSFVGAGYRLGETTEDTTVIQGAPRPESVQQVFLKLKMWKNGFSIDNGPLRDYSDETNKQFLDSISRGEVPQELIREAKGGEVNLDMEDHRTENFVAAKIKVKAFTGAGHMLGSPAPSVAASQSSPGAAAGGSTASSIQVDQSKPSTSVQIRLADGKRLVLKLNHSHTVRDIRQHIIVNNPQYAASNFCLQTTFPNKELTEESQTLEEANLLSAVIVQRLK